MLASRYQPVLVCFILYNKLCSMGKKRSQMNNVVIFFKGNTYNVLFYYFSNLGNITKT